VSVLPLRGLKVVSLEQAAAAPLCTRRLALAGAEVFKIERPEGDFARGYDSAVAGWSSYFVWLNAGKKSVVLDLKQPTQIETLKRLIGRCDVLVQNLKPGALLDLGIDLKELHRRRPDLISVSITGFHPGGPSAARKAYDLLMQAESGLADITGSPQEPGRVGVSIVDIATGMYAYESVLEAVLRRGASGIGGAVDIAMFDAVADLLGVPYLLERYGGVAPTRAGLAHPGICPYGVFVTRDGQPFVLAVQNEREWQRLCAADLGLSALRDDGRCRNNTTRVEHRSFVDQRLQDVFAERTYADVAATLSAADLAFAPVNGIDALSRHPDLRTQQVMVSGQTVLLPLVPGMAKSDTQQVPELGQHTEEVLRWLETAED
jgi:formyl-CoA transferase